MLNIKLSKLYPPLTAGLLTALGFTWAGIAQADRNDNPIMEDPVIAPGTMVTPSAVQSERTDNPIIEMDPLVEQCASQIKDRTYLGKECSNVLAQGVIPFANNTYEDLNGPCAYNPQSRSFNCPVKINGNLSGREWVLVCVFDGTWKTAGMSMVDVEASPVNFAPWYFGVTVQASPWLAAKLLNNATYLAKAILAYAASTTPPTLTCSSNPTWGDIEGPYNIKLSKSP